MKINLPILYNQQDSRWGNILLGNNSNQPFNLYNYGCLITCLAMLCKYYGKDVNPVDINEALKKKGGFDIGDGNYVWGTLPKVYSTIKEIKTDTPSLLNDSQVNEIKSSIDAGNPVMVQLDYNPQTVKNDTHYVLLIAYNPSEENDFTIADPIGGRIHSLKDYLGWFKPNARNTIEQIVMFTGPIPVTQGETITISIKDNETNVKKATQWDKIVTWLELGNPFDTLFENVQKVIAGIKSRATDLSNQLLDKDKVIGSLNQEVENQKDKNSRVEKQLTDEQKLRVELSNKLTDTLNSIPGIQKVYEDRLTVVTGQRDNEAKEKGRALLRIKELEIEIENLKKGSIIDLSAGELIELAIRKILNLKSS